VTLAIQLDHHVGAQDGVLLLAADPLEQLGLRPGSAREGTGIEGHEHRVQGLGGRLAAALAGGGDGALADGGGVASGHAEAVAGEGFPQRRPGDAELLGELEGALGLAAVGQEAAGLPAQGGNRVG
jgi:hypothetical protein